MNIIKTITALGFVTVVSACGGTEIASRNAPFEPASTPLAFAQEPTLQARAPSALPREMNVTRIDITVPRALKVSEANVYYPRGDIVWRDDPIGDRYTQIQNIFETGFSRGTQHMTTGAPVILNVELVRFHSLSEKARFSVGGVHNMIFKLTVHDANTGQAMMPTRLVEANLDAFGGGQAMVAERQGQTQKVRITGFLSQVIQSELAKPVTQPKKRVFGLVKKSTL